MCRFCAPWLRCASLSRDPGHPDVALLHRRSTQRDTFSTMMMKSGSRTIRCGPTRGMTYSSYRSQHLKFLQQQAWRHNEEDLLLLKDMEWRCVNVLFHHGYQNAGARAGESGIKTADSVYYLTAKLLHIDCFLCTAIRSVVPRFLVRGVLRKWFLCS